MEDRFITRFAYGKMPIIKCQPAPLENGQFPDHIKIPDSNGNILYTPKEQKELDEGKIFLKSTDVFELRDGMEWDLSNPMQDAIWKAIGHADFIVPERTAKDKNGNLMIDGDRNRYGNGDVYIERPSAIANTSVNKREKRIDAGVYIKDDSPEGIKLKCRMLGQFTEGRTTNDLKEYLYGLAEGNPDKVIDLYKGSDTQIRLLVMEAIEKRVINFRDNLYYFRDTTLLGGTTLDAVVNYLKGSENKKLFDLIKSEVMPTYKVENESVINNTEETVLDDEVEAAKSETSQNRPGRKPNLNKV